MNTFAVKVDYSFFEKVCYVVYSSFGKWREIPVDNLRRVLRQIADEHTEDKDTPFPECLPESGPFGGYYYPHEVFLQSVNFSHPSFWGRLLHKYKQLPLPKGVSDFAQLVIQRL